MSKLPEIKVKISVTEKLEESRGYLKAKSFKVHFDSCGESADAHVDYIDRKNTDAVCIIPYELKMINGHTVTHLYLRSCLRPSIELCSVRPEDLVDSKDKCKNEANKFKFNQSGNQWEFPAGMIEGEESVKKAAQRELQEEIGIYVNIDHFRDLGCPIFTSAGLAPEKIYFQLVEVNSRYMQNVTELVGDGSSLEKFGQVTSVSLIDALELCNDGSICDAKTTIGIYRAAKALGKTY